MIFKKFFLSFFLFLNLSAQEDLSYQTPPKEILELIDVSLPPRVLVDESKSYMIYLYRDNYKTIEELSEKEMRLAGLRICLLYTSPSPRDGLLSRMPSSA